MKAKLDENLPAQIALSLRSLGHDVETAAEEGLSGCTDDDLWMSAQHEGRALITQDLDFSDARRFSPGTHHGIVLIRLRSPSRLALLMRVEEVFRHENTREWPGSFVVVTDRKIRIRRAPDRPN